MVVVVPTAAVVMEMVGTTKPMLWLCQCQRRSLGSHQLQVLELQLQVQEESVTMKALAIMIMPAHSQVNPQAEQQNGSG